MNQIATRFLTRCFAPDETIALLLAQGESTATVTAADRARWRQALAPRYLGWLAHENTNGANIYVAANPLRPGSRKRTKESIASVRHLYIDIDTDGDARLAALRASDAGAAADRRSSPHRPASIRCFGGSKASTLSSRNRRSSCSPSPSAATQLAPTATVFFASPVS